MMQAEEELVKFVQGYAFEKELAILNSEAYRTSTSQGKLKSIGPLYKLNPILENRILRVGGRLRNALIDVNTTKHPSISIIIVNWDTLDENMFYLLYGSATGSSEVELRYKELLVLVYNGERRNAIPRSPIMAHLPIVSNPISHLLLMLGLISLVHCS